MQESSARKFMVSQGIRPFLLEWVDLGGMIDKFYLIMLCHITIESVYNTK